MASSNKRQRVEKLAQAHAYRIALAHPKVANAWGIAYDSFKEGLKAVTGANGMLTDDLRVEVERMIKGKYTPRYISNELGVEAQVIYEIYRELKPKKTPALAQ